MKGGNRNLSQCASPLKKKKISLAAVFFCSMHYVGSIGVHNPNSPLKYLHAEIMLQAHGV